MGRVLGAFAFVPNALLLGAVIISAVVTFGVATTPTDIHLMAAAVGLIALSHLLRRP